MDINEEEQKYLDYTLQKINLEIFKANEEMKQLIKSGTSLSFEDRKRGEHFNINARADGVDKRLGILKRSISTPYFGRMDVTLENEELKKIYLGKSSITSDSQIVVTDWRAPISSLYYDSEVGEVEFKAPGGQVKGNMSLKRQINIKDSKLIDVQDSSLVSNDDMLKTYLADNADNKMKIIIASIQKEQNDIIRKPSNANIIVQGVAGSGKTSVALHRIAYLIYELGNNISADQFLVLGPNEYFLNYVSSILPDLETSPVDQKTFIEFSRDYLEEKILLKSEEESKNEREKEISRKIKSFKTSIEYKRLIDEFMDRYLADGLVSNDFIINDEIIFTKEEVRNSLFSLDGITPNYERAYQVLSKKLKDNLTDIYDRVNKKYRDIYIKLSFEDDKRKKMTEKSSQLYDTLKNQGTRLLKKYINDIKENSTSIYSKFIIKLGNMSLPLSEKETLVFQKETLTDIKKKKIGFEDIPALLHINYRYTRKLQNYRYMVIDEAQDYGLFHFWVLKEINNNSNFAIYGDLAQSIYSYRSIDSWDKVNKEIFDSNCEILGLSKSYRTTIEITENANEILNYLDLKSAEPVIRYGLPVEFIDSAELNEKINIIKNLQTKDYKTVAIICKTEIEAEKLNKSLNNVGINSRYICQKDNEYSGGLFVLTSASSKGLEFDAVIINNASEDMYSTESDVDMHLLYVASTRALHELVILYDKNLTKVYEDNLEKSKVKKIKSFKV